MRPLRTEIAGRNLNSAELLIAEFRRSRVLPIFTLVTLHFAFSNVAFSQSQCPHGMIPGQGGCYSPIGGNSTQNSMGPKYENRYGAMAMSEDPNNDVIGTATAQKSQEEAIQIAMSKCGNACKIWFTVVNTCMAVAVGQQNGFNFVRAIGQSEGRARKNAIKLCNEKGFESCKAEFSSCSLPVRSY